MKIRKALAQDIPAIYDLMRATPEAPQWTIEQLVSMTEKAGSFLLLADFNSAIAGFIAISSIRLSGEIIAQLESIAVHESFRGNGIGAQLIRNAVLRVAMHSSGQMELEVRSLNQTALSLYKKTGFEVQGSRPGYYIHPPDDAVMMVLRFPQAPIA